MDSDLAKSLIAGVAAGMTSLALLPMIFKGQLLHKRELERLEKAHGEQLALYKLMIADRDDENDRLLAANAALATEIKEQNRAMAEQTREVLNAVKMLQSLAGLAAQERRRSGDD